MDSQGYVNQSKPITHRLGYALLLVLGVFISVAVTSGPAYAQFGQLNGTVSLKSSDSAPATPQADVDIVILRKDIKGKWVTKTDKKGRYVYSLPMFGIYVVSASGKGYRAQISPAMKLASDTAEVNIEITPGDGARPTDEQILSSVVQGAPGGGLTKEQQEELKKQQEERAKIEAENAKAQADFDQMKKHFEAGLALDQKKDYAGAVTEYRQAADFDKTQHAIFGNLSQALYNLGAIKFNAKQREEACKLFDESAKTGEKASELNATELNYKVFAARAYALIGQYCGDGQALDKASKLYQSAADQQTVPAEKNKLLLNVGKMYFSAGQTDNAITVFRNILASDANNVDTMFELAVAMTTDPAKLQECIKLFETVAEKAPASDPHKVQAADFAKTLKEAAKPANPPKKKG